MLTIRSDRHEHPPSGLDGGLAGSAGGYYRLDAAGRRQRLPDKATNVALGAGDRVVVETSGGGGIGSPSRRDRSAVDADLAEGRIGPEAASSVYADGPAPR